MDDEDLIEELRDEIANLEEERDALKEEIRTLQGIIDNARGLAKETYDSLN